VTVDTGAYVTVARPDIAAGYPERQPNQRYTLQTVSGEAPPNLKFSWHWPWGGANWKFGVFVAIITNAFIVAGHPARIWCICEPKEPNAASGRGRGIAMDPLPSSLVVANDQVIPAQCEGVVMAWLESPLRVENCLVVPRPEAHLPEGLYMSRTLVRDCREVPVRAQYGKTSPTAAPHTKLLGLMEISRCEGRHTRAPMGIHWWTF
jgi:hypothetical protein